jgi:hypothetical protein
MIIDVDELDVEHIYKLLIGTVVPSFRFTALMLRGALWSPRSFRLKRFEQRHPPCACNSLFKTISFASLALIRARGAAFKSSHASFSVSAPPPS